MKVFYGKCGGALVELNSIIGDIYDASSNDDKWLDVGKRLFGYLGAEAGSLRIQAPGGGSVNVFEARPASDHYAEHYLRIDPVRAAICRLRPNSNLAATVLLDDELVERTQIRTVLRKSNAANLRDFERIGALLGSLRQ